MKIKNEQGMALIVTLFFATVLYGLSAVFVLATVHEQKTVRAERETVKAFYAAQGGAQYALSQMDTLINDFLLNTIASAYPSGVVSFATSQVASGNGLGWLVYAVRDDDVPVLILNGDQAEYTESGTVGDFNYQFMIVMTEKGDPVTAGVDMWDFPFAYKIEAEGSSGGMTSRVDINGDFTVRLQRDNFSKFALFTNEQQTPGGTNVWFTDRTNFAGPVHTHDRFNGVLDVPVFHDDFQRDAEEVVLDSPVVEQDMVDQATAGQSFGGPGIYLPNNAGVLAGGIYVSGDSDITMSVDGDDNAVYTITQGAVTNEITVDTANNETVVYDPDTGTETTYSGFPDGVEDVGTLIYVDGSLNNLGGTVQADTQMTIASSNDIVINDHVVYEEFTPAVGNPGDIGYVPPYAEDATNLLGIVSWGGDVRIGSSAPDDVNIHGTILASSGIFTVDDYNDQGVGPRGSATLLGGVITDNYGAFGLFNGSTGEQLSGYGRNFVYDQRMKQGQSSPYFPSLNTFIAFTNDITDKMVWQEGE